MRRVQQRFPDDVQASLAGSVLRRLETERFIIDVACHELVSSCSTRDRHAAAGAAVSLRLIVLWRPLVVVYQVARRVRDDEALTQLVGLALGG